MKLRVDYFATYRYERKASFSPHLARIFPRHDLFVRAEHVRFKATAGADVQYRHDLFDNLVARCFFPEEMDTLDFRMKMDLQIEPKNAFHFLLESRALEIPFSYLPEETAVLGACLAPSKEKLKLPAPLGRAPARPTVDALVAMNDWLHKNIAYERREEGEAWPASETLQKERGSCRDFAVLFCEVLRRNGIAARQASGYLWEDDDPDSPRRAENAMHAWIEAYLPGAGWIGMDPTNGVLCDHHFIPAAVGLTPEQIAPISGFYYGKKTIGSTMESFLKITEVK